MLQHGKRPTIASRHGMVAAAHPLAAAAGARILGNGGNAFDAAAATAATLNVVEPYMSGLAGMGMATCYVASERRVRSLNFMSLIPRKFPLEKLNSREQIVRGPIPVGSPGNLAGWCEMVEHLRHQEAARAVRAGDRRRARRLRPDRVQRRGDRRRHLRAARQGQALSRMVAHLSRRHRRRPAGAGRRAEAARPRQHPGGPGGRRSRADVWRRARQEGGRAAGRARRHAHHGRPDGLQGALDRSGRRQLSRPHHPRAAAALRGVPVPADPAHPRRLRSRQAAAQRHRAYRHRAARHPHRRGRAHRQRRALAAEARRASVGRPCREPAGAGARRQAGGRADRAVDAAGKRGPHHVVLHRRQARQHGVRDAESRQRVRLGRRRARHRRLPQQLPLLGRRQSRRAPTA